MPLYTPPAPFGLNEIVLRASGGDDLDIFQAAVAAAGTRGVRILLPDPLYYLSDELHITADNIFLVGVGDSSGQTARSTTIARSARASGGAVVWFGPKTDSVIPLSSWALLGGLAAALIGLPVGLESGLRSAGCGFFYGLLAFHLQRVDPDDEHLAAGLVGAVCGIRSLGGPVAVTALALPVPEIHSLLHQPLAHSALAAITELMRGWLPLWLPLIGSALLLQGAQRLLPALRP
jgi:hypothetical protein